MRAPRIPRTFLTPLAAVALVATAVAGSELRSGAAPTAVPGLAAEEIADLRMGRGMGQARVADVQGYPGPRHVLEAVEAGQLTLSDQQVARVRDIHRAMAAAAQRLGGEVLEAERALADALGTGGLDAAGLRARVDRIAALRGALRVVHLEAHLATRAVLDPEQLARYARLRGHAPPDSAPGHRH